MLALALLVLADTEQAGAAGLGDVTDAVSRTAASGTETLRDAGVPLPTDAATEPLPSDVPELAPPAVDTASDTLSGVVDPVVDAVARGGRAGGRCCCSGRRDRRAGGRAAGSHR